MREIAVHDEQPCLQVFESVASVTNSAVVVSYKYSVRHHNSRCDLLQLSIDWFFNESHCGYDF